MQHAHICHYYLCTDSEKLAINQWKVRKGGGRSDMKKDDLTREFRRKRTNGAKLKRGPPMCYGTIVYDSNDFIAPAISIELHFFSRGISAIRVIY